MPHDATTRDGQAPGPQCPSRSTDAAGYSVSVPVAAVRLTIRADSREGAVAAVINLSGAVLDPRTLGNLGVQVDDISFLDVDATTLSVTRTPPATANHRDSDPDTTPGRPGHRADEDRRRDADGLFANPWSPYKPMYLARTVLRTYAGQHARHLALSELGLLEADLSPAPVQVGALVTGAATELLWLASREGTEPGELLAALGSGGTPEPARHTARVVLQMLQELAAYATARSLNAPQLLADAAAALRNPH